MTKDKDFLHANNYICKYLSAMQKPPLHTSFLNAFRGVFLMIKSERNFQIETAAFVINLFLILYLNLTATDAVIIIIISSLVLAAEIFNTAIERICDIIQPEFDRRIGFIKDISAGAVFLISISSVVAGVYIYWKYLFP
jgi:diacylglycerol kinase (ATP)